MTEDQFIAAVALRMRSSRCDIMPYGPAITLVPVPNFGRTAKKKMRLEFSIGTGPFAGKHWSIGIDALGDKDVKNVATSLSNWWKGILWEESMVDAAWLYHGIGTPRPYLVDAVADRLLASKGIGWSTFVAIVEANIGLPPSEFTNHARRRHHAVWDTALRTYDSVPADFMGGYYRRSIDLSGGRLGVLGPTQFKLGCNGRRNLRMDIQIAPGVTWMSSSNPTVMVNQRFPDAMCQGVRGRHLTEVVGAAVFDIPGLVIKSMRTHGDRTDILVADVRVDVAESVRPALGLAA